MRLTALLGCAALLAGCAKAESPPVADTMAMSEPAPAAAMSVASVAGMWNVRVLGETGDSTLTTYVLNTSDSSAWTLTFPNRDPIPLRITGVSGDSIMTESGPFESNLRRGVQVRTSVVWRMEGGKLMGYTVARYATTGADSVVNLRSEGTRQ